MWLLVDNDASAQSAIVVAHRIALVLERGMAVAGWHCGCPLWLRRRRAIWTYGVGVKEAPRVA